MLTSKPCIGVFLSLWILSVPLSVSARDAQTLYKEGTRAFDKGQYNEAAASFRSAYEAKPSWKLHFNIGQSLAAARDYGGALEAFERYLAEGGDEISEKRSEEVLKEITRLRNLVGYLKILAPADSKILINGELRGVAPLSVDIPLTVGVSHSVSVVSDDNIPPIERSVTVRAGVTTEVSLVENAQPAADVPAPTPQPVTDNTPTADQKSPDPLRITGWILAGSGTAMLIGAGILGGIALSMDKSLSDTCDNDTCGGDDWSDAEKMKNLGVSADVLFIVGGVVTATGIALLIAGTKKEHRTNPPVSFRPVFSANAMGALVTGEF